MGRKKKLGMVGVLLLLLYITNILQAGIQLAYLWLSEQHYTTLRIIDSIILVAVIVAMVVLLIRNGGSAE